MNEIVKISADALNQTTAGKRLENKAVVLTGAAGSIGRFITRQLLREGARVMLTGRDQDKLDDFIATLTQEGFDADSMITSAGDCADPEVCRQIATTTAAMFGRIDVLVNNAGAAGPKFTLRDIPFTEAEMRSRESDQTMFDSAMNLLGAPGIWRVPLRRICQLARLSSTSPPFFHVRITTVVFLMLCQSRA